MFSKILIANRGEIACRIIKTARRMGIATVAVYSEADAEALHVRMADEAVAIGGAPASESYLVAERIVQAATATGAEAVHPGFGFLAENAAFAEALEAAGLVFIGPPPAAIAAMGDKIESKKLADEAGVNTIPGHPEAIDDAGTAAGIAAGIGYPVMIKASAGGGGKGMRIAHDAAGLEEGFASARSEAASSFGDDRILIEKFIEEPRHIEIQVLADGHGNCIYLGERECSIQRRHQKVVEEAPSPFIDAETRALMGNQAVALATAVGYRSAGTVEFVVDTKRNFYFLEMNTRLQVEHPVTELVTGIDLVEEMLRVAAGERLRLSQDEVRLDGWALECRIYAEDPARGFLPSVGRLTHCRPPVESDTVRVDTGVEEGSEISMFYDPMIAKLVTRGEDRAGAIEAMEAALDAYYLRGISHNVDFLAAVMASARFRDGRLSTAFIEEEFGDSFNEPELPEAARDVLLGAAALVHHRRQRRTSGVALPPEWVVRLGSEALALGLAETESGLVLQHDGRRIEVSGDWRPGAPLFQGRVGEHRVTVQVDGDGIASWLGYHGFRRRCLVLRPRAAALAALMPEKAPPDHSKYLLAPMSGLVVAVHVEAGDEVKAGQPLAVVEAMKMENVLRAERDGVVAEVSAAPGQSLAQDQVILEFAA
ncbi:MAG: acetyl/propionyl/methylcrotonyl-CoA carboxylase subunit alpha [Alphaproteobacteria bacterium]|jgi:propionyl-CoA carboxylase alpha chain|nr:acetyl/propionyl/methylcrotonyl-CoA carboxylase subunit alpha [Alphaproteobacteria bacterium]